jgi:protein-S-isoprenylcysteine O-methyltransferase Ste14
MNSNDRPVEKTRRGLVVKIFFRIFFIFIFMGILFFLPAGSLQYWEAWIYIVMLIITAFFVIVYFIRKDPDLLENRILKRREKEKEHKSIQNIFSFVFLTGLLIPGFDHRFHWSDIPFYIVLISDLFVLIGYLMIVRVMKENSYASAIIEKKEDQRVIETGPYKIVRHPMYTGGLIFIICTPVALGSYWAFILFLILTPVVLVLRIKGEEKYLIANLQGYKEYCQKTKYHLIPFIW